MRGWIALTAAFMLWAYWPRLVDRFHHDSPQQENTHDHDRTGASDS